MITKSINKLLRVSAVACAACAALVACTDTWDDHYESTIDGVNKGSLWQAIKQNPDLSHFASVIEATGYDKSLGSSQVFTVFAPTNDNFTASDAEALINQYKIEKQTVNDDDNTVVKEFVQNHIALYNYSVSPQTRDSIVLMNGKYALLLSDKIDNSAFVSGNYNKLYENGVLFTLDKTIDYSANIFEYLRKDPDLDSVRSFFYNPLFYDKEFVAASSVEGGLDSLGRTIYLDSVYRQRNDLYSQIGLIGSEDSTYWMVAPTNEAWRKLVNEYEQYFQYSPRARNLLTVGDLDSLIYTQTRLAIMEGTVFSRTINDSVISRKKPVTSERDSIFSYNAVPNYNLRSYLWGANFNYYQFFDPSHGIFNEPDSVQCSNGQIMKVNDWKIDKLQTFHRWVIIEAERQGSIRSIGKQSINNGRDSVNMYGTVTCNVYNDNFKGKVWNNRYVEFVPNVANLMPNVTFNITDVLSNVGYDIYVVTAPALANDSNATASQSLPTSFRCTINYVDANGKAVSTLLKSPKTTNAGVVTTSGNKVDYMLMAEDFKFSICTYGLDEVEPMITMLVENRVTNTQITRGTHTRTLRVDCILLVPHGTLDLSSEDMVVMHPHGDNLNTYFKSR